MKILKTLFGVGLLILLGCNEEPDPVARLAVEPATLELGYPGIAELRLRFEPLVALDVRRPYVFVHLLDGEGNVMRTFDHLFPTDWRAGETVEETVVLYQSALAAPLPAGEYPLTVGLYDPSGRRWSLDAGEARGDRQEYEVAAVRVPEGGSGPMFFFSPSWLPPEGGTDRQVLGRRWLTEDGSLRLAEFGAGGRLWMTLRIPEPEPAVEDLVLEEGAEGPAVIVRESCLGDELTLAGTGSHVVDLAIAPPLAEEGGPEECELSLEPNFLLVAKDSGQAKSLALEVLAWTQ